MKKELKYIVLLILVIFLSNFVFSIGLAPSKYRMEVQPNNQYIIMYSVMGVSNFEPIVGSDPLLKKYIKVGEITTDERGVHHFPASPVQVSFVRFLLHSSLPPWNPQKPDLSNRSHRKNHRTWFHLPSSE